MHRPDQPAEDPNDTRFDEQPDETGIGKIAGACRKCVGPVATAEDPLQAAARVPPACKKILLSGVGLEPVNAALRNSAPDGLRPASWAARDAITKQKAETQKP